MSKSSMCVLSISALTSFKAISLVKETNSAHQKTQGSVFSVVPLCILLFIICAIQRSAMTCHISGSYLC